MRVITIGRIGPHYFMLGLVAAALIAAACGGGADDATSSDTRTPPDAQERTEEQVQAERAQAEQARAAQAQAEQAQAEQTPAGQAQAEQAEAEQAAAEQTQAEPAAPGARFDGEGDYAGGRSFDWRVARVDQGVKPDLVLRDGQPLIAYMLERTGADGYVRVASGTPGAFQFDDLQRGYFYGPLDIELSADGVAAVGYHNHDWEDGAVAVQSSDGWELHRIVNDGHDGWDSALAFGPAGGLHFLGIDPFQFGSAEGVEHAALIDGEWQVTAIGSGRQPYEWGTDVAVDTQGGLHAVYFDAGGLDLIYASNTGGGWQIESIYTDGDAGRFAVLALTTDGTPHVAFFQSDSPLNPEGPAPGAIVYGTIRDGAWAFQQIGEVGGDHVLGFEDARRSIAIALHNDRPTVAWIDRARLSLATHDGGAWTFETVFDSGGQEFQVVGLALDDAGAPHLTFSTVGHNPLDGEVWYVAPVARG